MMVMTIVKEKEKTRLCRIVVIFMVGNQDKHYDSIQDEQFSSFWFLTSSPTRHGQQQKRLTQIEEYRKKIGKKSASKDNEVARKRKGTA
jgi:hypothetical protein